MTVDIPTYVPPPGPERKPPERVDETKAREILTRVIEGVRQSNNWFTGKFLFEINEDADGILPDNHIMEKDKLQEVALAVMKEYGLDEKDCKADLRADHDPIDHRTQQGYSTEYRTYPNRTRDLFFERDVRVENNKKRWAKWTVNKSSLFYPESRKS